MKWNHWLRSSATMSQDSNIMMILSCSSLPMWVKWCCNCYFSMPKTFWDMDGEQQVKNWTLARQSDFGSGCFGSQRITILSHGWGCTAPGRPYVESGDFPGLAVPAQKEGRDQETLWTTVCCALVMFIPGPIVPFHSHPYLGQLRFGLL